MSESLRTPIERTFSGLTHRFEDQPGCYQSFHLRDARQGDILRFMTTEGEAVLIKMETEDHTSVRKNWSLVIETEELAMPCPVEIAFHKNGFRHDGAVARPGLGLSVFDRESKTPNRSISLGKITKIELDPIEDTITD